MTLTELDEIMDAVLAYGSARSRMMAVDLRGEPLRQAYKEVDARFTHIRELLKKQVAP
jgi:hypothetical protein